MAAAANLNLMNQLDQTIATPRTPIVAPNSYLISGVPTLDWHKIKKLVDDLLSKIRVGGTLNGKDVAQTSSAQHCACLHFAELG